MDIIENIENTLAQEALSFPVLYFMSNGKRNQQKFLRIHKDFRQEAMNLYFIHFAIKKHGRRYGYRDVVYKTANTYVKIHCPEHGIFLQTPRNHLMGGCKKCAQQNINITNNIRE